LLGDPVSVAAFFRLPHGAKPHPDPELARAGVYVGRGEDRRLVWEGLERLLWERTANWPWMPPSLRPQEALP
jgi:hypothetical protein